MRCEWERVDLERLVLRVEETKTGEPLELPITRQLAAIFWTAAARIATARPRSWRGLGVSVVAEYAKSGHVTDLSRSFYPKTSDQGWRARGSGSTACATAFITVAERELMLPRSLTKRLVNHTRPSGCHRGLRRGLDDRRAAARDPRRRFADRIDELCALVLFSGLLWRGFPALFGLNRDGFSRVRLF